MKSLINKALCIHVNHFKILATIVLRSVKDSFQSLSWLEKKFNPLIILFISVF